MTYVVIVDVAIACIVMAHKIMAYIDTTCIPTTYAVNAYVAMAYIVKPDLAMTLSSTFDMLYSHGLCSYVYGGTSLSTI